MKDRFTRESRRGRGNIPKATRRQVYKRDGFKCIFCQQQTPPAELTIDHLVPLDRGGLDEITNYVSACKCCNQRKANSPLDKFAQTISIQLEELPVHGDPIIDNEEIPIEIRLLRKNIYDQHRREELSLSGKQAQKRFEKVYRRSFWQTEEGQALEMEFPTLPGHARVMITEIKTVAKSPREFWLLVELSKSAATRNLIGTTLVKGCDVEKRFRDAIPKTRKAPLKKRMEQALKRFENNVR